MNLKVSRGRGNPSGGSGVSSGDSSGGSSNIVIDGFGETSGDASAEVGGGDSNTREAEDPVDPVGGDTCCNMGDSPPDSGLGSINIGDSTSTSTVGGCTFTAKYDLEGRLVGGTFSQGCFGDKGTERTKNESIENIESCPECPKPSDGVVGVLPPLENDASNTPCKGDPITNPEASPQKGVSGINGAFFGCTRFNPKSSCKGVKGSQIHNGIDLKSNFGDPIYAMFDGSAELFSQKDEITGEIKGAGHYVEITSVINGEKVKILYFHLQNERRKSGLVEAGDIIGFQGDSGNLKNAIKNGKAESHLHIKVKIGNKAVDPNEYLATKFNPITGEITQKPTNCN
jgi:hypothetical protein